MSGRDRKRAHDRGLWAEWLAAGLLLVKGYRILGRRVRNRAGELDLIARRGNVVAFVEVKARADAAAAETALGERQRQRITRAASAWLAGQPHLQALNPRFDLILVSPGLLPRHRTDAWRTEFPDI